MNKTSNNQKDANFITSIDYSNYSPCQRYLTLTLNCY